MSLLVQKFGGTSVGGLDRIDGVAARIAETVRAGHQVVVVVSAMAGETDRLLDLAYGASPHGRPNPRELDVLLSTGENVTTALLCMSLEGHGITACSFNGRQAGILTDERHSRAGIESVDTRRLKKELARGRVPVVAGFQGESKHGNVTTLGRGGSDTTAVALAAALGADECQIFTDVDGVYTADPRVVPEARRLEEIGFPVMQAMAEQGSKVLQRDSVATAWRSGVNLRVLSTFEAGPGTRICESVAPAPGGDGVVAIAAWNAYAALQLTGVPTTDFGRDRLLECLDSADMHYETQGEPVVNGSHLDFNLAVGREDFDLAKERLSQALAGTAAEIQGDSRVAKVSLIGVRDISHASIAARLDKALVDTGIPVGFIAHAEHRISIFIAEEAAGQMVRALHKSFHLHDA